MDIDPDDVAHEREWIDALNKAKERIAALEEALTYIKTRLLVSLREGEGPVDELGHLVDEITRALNGEWE